MSFFSIDPTLDHVTLGPDGTGNLAFSVANKTGVGRQVKAVVEPDGGAEQQSWYTVDPAIQAARVDETVQFTVAVAVPPGTAVGDYPFRLKVVAEDDPDDVYSESPRVTVEVPELEEKEKPFPWLLLVAAAVAVIVIGVVGVLVFGGGGGDDVETLPTMGPSDPPEILDIVGGGEFNGTREVGLVEEADVPMLVDVRDDEDAVTELTISWLLVDPSTEQVLGGLGTGRTIQATLPSGCFGPRTHTVRVLVVDSENNAAVGTTEVTIVPVTPNGVGDCVNVTVPTFVLENPFELIDPDVIRQFNNQFTPGG